MLRQILRQRALRPLQEKELYGDCWTPLMAAAVADHCGIVVLLLEAAGTHARALVKHTNRKGLTAAHVAARRGGVPVLQQLLAAAGGGIATTPDHMNRWGAILHVLLSDKCTSPACALLLYCSEAAKMPCGWIGKECRCREWLVHLLLVVSA